MHKCFVFVITLAILMLITYSIVIEPNFIITTTYVNVSIKNLPESFNGFRIVHITDVSQ
jgi:predicted MPP superfamily phosphohydrolase